MAGLVAGGGGFPAEFWDGVTHAYLPQRELVVPDGLVLSSEFVEEIDPITYEVVRHALWNTNGEHGRVIQNLAVSPIAVEIRDFQTCILTEDAELLYFGPYLQYMAGQLDMMVKFLIERRGHKVRDGDMWLCNDPIIGTAHQPDVCVMCPVFVDGELFCWVANVVHQNDIGGTVPGSFCPNAEDVYFDPPSFPPIRIVADGQIDDDLEELYRRCSRTPVNLSLDLRATIAGNHAAKVRIQSLVAKYGKGVVKGVMRRVLDASQRAFETVLDTIPDGVYSERLIQEVSRTGDRGAYPVQLSVRKRGRSLVFDNVGTHAQVGAINVGFAGARGCVLGAINVLLLADQMGCVGGALRNVLFDPTPGTITCPDWGAAVSPAGIYSTETVVSLGTALVAKMMLCSSDPVIRDRAIVSESAQWPCHFTAGLNQRGDYYVGGQGDNMIGSTGPTWRRDGEFANGHYWIPEGRGPNVELYERDWPILYLFRREQPDSAGAGRFRGGSGGELAYVPHKGQSGIGLYCSEGIPKTPGMLGGDPGPTCRTRYIQGSNIRALFAAGQLCVDLDALTGNEAVVHGKGPAFLIGADDVLYWNWLSTGGYGDPITRDPQLVAADVAGGIVSLEKAHRTYAVVFAGDGSVAEEATAVRRRAVRLERLGQAGAPRQEPAASAPVPQGVQTVGDVYWLDRASGEYRCCGCATALGPIAGNPKETMALWEHPIEDLGIGMPSPRVFVDVDVVWRDFFCPGCGTRIATETAFPGEPPLHEFDLH
jgi:N-methylhydantoinase B